MLEIAQLLEYDCGMRTRAVRFLLLIIGAAVLFFIFYPLFHDTRFGVSMISNLLIAYGSVWCFYSLKDDRSIRQLLGIRTLDLTILGIITMLTTAGVLGVLFGLAGTINRYLDISSWTGAAHQPLFLFTMLFYVLLSIPLQEYIFRGYVWALIRHSVSHPWVAIGISSFLYSISHLQYGWLMMAVTFSFGLFLGYIMERYRRIALPIIIHLLGGVAFFSANLIIHFL